MALLRGFILISILYYAVSVPVQPRKKPSEDTQLKRQLGEEDYQKLRQHLDSEKLDAMKKFVHLKPEEREKFVKHLKEEFEKRKHHETVYEPGSRPQLQEVWRDEDKMDDFSFSPEMVFKKHDLNEDQILDEHEINALIEHEVEKIYPFSSVEDKDMRKLEVDRMRKAFFERIDHNHDGKITLSEFSSPSQDEDDDDEWTPLQDLEEMPDFEKKTDDKEFLGFAQKQLELHPDDEDLENVMHILHGVKGVPDPSAHPSPAVNSYMKVNAPSGGGGSVHPPVPPAPAPAASQEKLVETHL